jgi:PAS domain S-box-containing protein
MADQPVRFARHATGLLALGALVVLLAALAESLGWHAGLMHVIGAIAGTAVMLMAIVLVYRQTQRRRGADKATQEEEARVAAIVESAMDAVIATDGNQRIVLFNTAAEKVFGWPRDAIIGKSLELLMPQSVRAAHHAHVERFAATGTTSRRMGDKTVLVGLRANGEEFPIEAAISHTGAGSNRYFTVILRDVTERMNAEHALRQSREELREMAAAAHSVREQEKSRIARELHDELAQSLTSLKMDLAATRDELSTEDSGVAKRLDTMQKMLDGMVASTRRIASDLRPLMLDDLGLVPAAEWLTQNFTERTGIGCAFSADPAEIEMQDPHATAVFRILQESLTNVARHAQASQVDVTLDGNDGEIVLRVRDNGCGFEPGGPRKPNSLGLVGLRERATLLGGEIDITAAPGKGTVVEVRIPLQPAESQP